MHVEVSDAVQTVEDVQEYMACWALRHDYWRDPWAFYFGDGLIHTKAFWREWKQQALAAGHLVQQAHNADDPFAGARAPDDVPYKLTEAWRREVEPLTMQALLLGIKKGQR